MYNKNTFSCIKKYLLSLYIFLYNNNIYFSLYKKLYNEKRTLMYRRNIYVYIITNKYCRYTSIVYYIQ